MTHRQTNDKILYGGPTRRLVLRHAAEAPIRGLWIIEEVRQHGYEIGADVVCPTLHGLTPHDVAHEARKALTDATVR